jgi:hypothetical protein
MAYPSENSVVDDVYGQYDNSALSAYERSDDGIHAVHDPGPVRHHYSRVQLSATTVSSGRPAFGSPHSPPNRGASV